MAFVSHGFPPKVHLDLFLPRGQIRLRSYVRAQDSIWAILPNSTNFQTHGVNYIMLKRKPVVFIVIEYIFSSFVCSFPWQPRAVPFRLCASGLKSPWKKKEPLLGSSFEGAWTLTPPNADHWSLHKSVPEAHVTGQLNTNHRLLYSFMQWLSPWLLWSCIRLDQTAHHACTHSADFVQMNSVRFLQGFTFGGPCNFLGFWGSFSCLTCARHFSGNL